MTGCPVRAAETPFWVTVAVVVAGTGAPVAAVEGGVGGRATCPKTTSVLASRTTTNDDPGGMPHWYRPDPSRSAAPRTTRTARLGPTTTTWNSRPGSALHVRAPDSGVYRIRACPCESVAIVISVVQDRSLVVIGAISATRQNWTSLLADAGLYTNVVVFWKEASGTTGNMVTFGRATSTTNGVVDPIRSSDRAGSRLLMSTVELAMAGTTVKTTGVVVWYPAASHTTIRMVTTVSALMLTATTTFVASRSVISAPGETDDASVGMEPGPAAIAKRNEDVVPGATCNNGGSVTMGLPDGNPVAIVVDRATGANEDVALTLWKSPWSQSANWMMVVECTAIVDDADSTPTTCPLTSTMRLSACTRTTRAMVSSRSTPGNTDDAQTVLTVIRMEHVDKGAQDMDAETRRREVASGDGDEC